MQQELAVAFQAPDGRVDEGEGMAAGGANGVFHAMEGQRVGGECTDQRSCGVRPVFLAMRASILGPISSASWKAQVKSG